MSADDNWQLLTGQSRDVLQPVIDGHTYLLHTEVLPHWRDLVGMARSAGFSLAIASAWRSFDRQCTIWNGKATGQRTVLDSGGNPLDVARLSQDELLFSILRWSAIPGCSRHHWGTDLDVFDAGAVALDYNVQLTTAECVDGGPFSGLHAWLDNVLQKDGAVFFRPYAEDCGGIAPERWHLSCGPIATRYEALLDESRLLEWILQQDIALKDRIRVHWHEIFHRFVLVRHKGEP